MKRITLNLIGISVLLSVALFAGPDDPKIEKKGDRYFCQKESVLDMKPGSLLKMRNTTADVHLDSWEKDKVKIVQKYSMDVFTEKEAVEIVNQNKLSIKFSNTKLEIEPNKNLDHVSIDYFITLPQKVDVDIHLSSGDISAGNLECNQMKLRTTDGDINAREILAKSVLHTNGGDLELQKIYGELQASTSGGDIDLKDIFCRTKASTNGGDIDLENSDHDITLDTRGGEINIRNTTGEINASTMGGEIDVENCSGRVRVRTNGGEISMKNLADISARTMGGEIDGENITGRLDCETMGGEIELTNIKGPSNVKAVGGDVEFKFTLKDFSKPHNINVETTGGDIDASLPAKLPATIVAEILLDKKDRSWNRYNIFSEFPLTATPVDETQDYLIRSTGEINGGGDRVFFKTINGNINIKRN